jgi:hypothetical protein
MKNVQSRMGRLLFASTAAALMLGAGCTRPSSNTAANAPVAPTAAATVETPRNTVLRTSAEPFEVLTERAFAAPWVEIDRLITDARSAASAARNAAPAGAAALDQRVAAIAAARQAQDRPALALAAVETYRQLVQSQDAATAPLPIPISLLDYAGFRYDALAQAPKVDWAAMDQSVSFANQQWKAIAPKIPSQSLHGVMQSSLDAMSAAVNTRDITFARSAAATELALVDLLEEQVATQPAGPAG